MIARILAIFRQPVRAPEPVSDFRDHPRMLAKHAMRVGNRAPELVAKVERVHTILEQRRGMPYLPTATERAQLKRD